MSFDSIDLMMQRAVEDRIFPGGALVISKFGTVLFNKTYGYANLFTKRPLTQHTFFDLASLTKPLATTLCLMLLVQTGNLHLDRKLGALIKPFSGTSKSDIQIRHLLCHNSGLPAYHPYFMKIYRTPFNRRKDILRNLLVQEAPISDIGEKTLYSDIGFMILEWIIETVTGTSLDCFVDQEIYQPLGIRSLFFVNLKNVLPNLEFAATELCPWRRCLIEGIVHDENAYAMGGIAGHSGLFGTAAAIHQLLHILMKTYHKNDHDSFFKKEIVHLFFHRAAGADRSLGFDVPSECGSSSGDLFPKDMTVGHLGFTGTSFWMDLSRSIIIVLLTNRIHPSRNDERIKQFRPLLHNAIMNQLISTQGV